MLYNKCLKLNVFHLMSAIYRGIFIYPLKYIFMYLATNVDTMDTITVMPRRKCTSVYTEIKYLYTHIDSKYVD